MDERADRGVDQVSIHARLRGAGRHDGGGPGAPLRGFQSTPGSEEPGDTSAETQPSNPRRFQSTPGSEEPGDPAQTRR